MTLQKLYCKVGVYKHVYVLNTKVIKSYIIERNLQNKKIFDFLLAEWDVSKHAKFYKARDLVILCNLPRFSFSTIFVSLCSHWYSFS